MTEPKYLSIEPEASDAQVYTFYSYKGGVGRSMAMANVGELLYRRGLRVLMIDFDLEAPGLERYFDVPEAATNMDGVLDRRGLMDLLVSYKSLRSLPALTAFPPPPPLPPPSEKDFVPGNGGDREVGCMNLTDKEISQTTETTDTLTPTDIARANSATAGANKTDDGFRFPYPVEPLANFIVPIYTESSNGGTLSLITAGRRIRDEFAHYAKNVRTFGWEEFFNNWAGEQFFEWFRREAKRHADIVLIDSRTGVTEMSGVCSYQLADTVVFFVAPNYQNLDGTRRIAHSLRNPDLIKVGRGGRPLWTVFVPSRVEPGEGDKLDEFKSHFTSELNELYPRQMTFKKDPFIDLRIPYVPYFAFNELVAVRDANHAKAAEIAAAIEKLVEKLAELEPPGSKLRRLYELTDDERTGIEIEETFARFSPEEQNLMRVAIMRLAQIGSPEEGGVHTTFLRRSFRSFNPPEQAIVERMAESRLLIIENDATTGDRVVRVTDEKAILTWKRFGEWLAEDGEFLVWRQQTKANIEQWRANGQDESFLLSGKALELAASWQARRGRELDDGERQFVSESMGYDERRKQIEIERLKQLEIERQKQSELVALNAQQQQQQVQIQAKQRRTYIGAGFFVTFLICFILAAGGFLYWRQFRQNVEAQQSREQERIELLATSYNTSGDDSFERGDYEDAISSYTRAVEIKPDYAEAYVNRGNAYLRQQKFDDARADFDKAISSKMDFAEAYNGRGLANLTGAEGDDINRAIIYLDKAIELKPDYAEAYLNRGVAYRRQQNIDRALADLTRSIELKTDYAEAYYERGLVYSEAGKFGIAAEEYQNAIRIATIPVVKTNAQRALDELVNNQTIPIRAADFAPPPAAAPRIYFHYYDPDDLDALRFIAKNVAESEKFSDVQSIQLRPEATNGDVRYFYTEDADNARAVGDIVRRSLAARGFKLDVQPRFLGRLYRNVPRGQLEVWLPSLRDDANSNAPAPQRQSRPNLNRSNSASSSSEKKTANSNRNGNGNANGKEYDYGKRPRN